MLLCAAMVLTCGQAFAAPVTGEADIVFVLDTTGSMSPYISAIRKELGRFMTELGKYDLSCKFAVLEYKDVTIDREKNSAYIVPKGTTTTWVTTKDAFDSRLETSLENVSGGGDWPETPQAALQIVADWTGTDWKSQNARVVFLLTDAPSRACLGHNTMENDATLINALKADNVIVSVIATTEDKEHYRPLFQGTNGVFIDIMTEDWYKSMMDIATYIAEMAETSADQRLPYTTVETVEESDIEKVAEETGVNADDINAMTDANRPLYDPSLPHEVSEDIKNALSNDIEFLTKIDTVILYAEGKAKGDWGYFLFEFEIPSSLVTSTSTLTVGNATKLDTEYNVTSGDYVCFAMLDPTTANKVTKLQSKVLVLLYGRNEDALVLYLVKDKKDDNKIKLWKAGDVSTYVTENREDTKTSLEQAMRDLAKEGKSFADVLKETWDNTESAGSYTERAKSFLKALFDAINNLLPDDLKDKIESLVGDGSSGCDAGLGLVGVLALAGFAFRKR